MKVWRMFFLLALLVSFVGHSQCAVAGAEVTGRWQTLPYTTKINPIHVALLYNAKILIVAGSENEEGNTNYVGGTLDLATKTFNIQSLDRDLFCNAMAALADGRIVIAGGTKSYSGNFEGLKGTNIYDPQTDQFFDGADMAEGRWYPFLGVLGDGSMVVLSGLTEWGYTNMTAEFLDPLGLGWSIPYDVPFTPVLYPLGHFLPNGQVFIAGSDPVSQILDPATKTWQVGPSTFYRKGRVYGTSVLLPLLPELDYLGSILIMGGHNPATNTAERIDATLDAPGWYRVPSMQYARIELNATLLPDKKVLVTGGSARDNIPSTASKPAELFDPDAISWTTLASARYARLYHSVALLLPDATVWTAGSNPKQGTVERHMEIFSPPYLFTTDGTGKTIPAKRPVITTIPSQISYAQGFAMSVDDANNIAYLSLMRLGSATHATNYEQRLVGLTFTVTDAKTLTVTGPPTSTIAPPGYYMLFAVNRNGVPSIAPFVHLN